MRKALNTVRIEGRVYQHKLSIKTVQNSASKNFGKSFISGEMEIATDDNCLNIVPVHCTYVTETNAKGDTNRTYTDLVKIMNGKTVITDGKDEATKVRVDSAIALNDFYTNDGNLVSAKRIEGGFVTVLGQSAELSPEEERNTFSVDMVITNINIPEVEEGKEFSATIRGAIFNFRNDILPLEFTIKNKDGIKYFESLGITAQEPAYTKVWGNINCTTNVQNITEESAFGEASVRTITRTTREWIVKGTAKVPYEFGDENILTADDLKTALQNRETMLADVKARADEYRTQKAAQPTANVTVAPKKDSFMF